MFFLFRRLRLPMCLAALVVAGVMTMFKEYQHGMSRKEYIHQFEKELTRRIGDGYDIEIRDYTPDCDTDISRKSSFQTVKRLKLNKIFATSLTPAQAAREVAIDMLGHDPDATPTPTPTPAMRQRPVIVPLRH